MSKHIWVNGQKKICVYFVKVIGLIWFSKMLGLMCSTYVSYEPLLPSTHISYGTSVALHLILNNDFFKREKKVRKDKPNLPY